MPDDYVSDDEELYRNVRGALTEDEYYYDDDKSLVITRQAFLSPEKEPSVDRAKLKNFDPQQSKLNETNGIVTLVTEEVRGIGDVATSYEGKENVEHAVDVKPDPKPDNEAHSLIVVTPEFFGGKDKQKSVFKLLRIALARLATEKGWTIPPSG